MNETGLTTNALEVFEQFREFNLKEMRKATKTALRKGAQVLSKNTKKQLRQKLRAASKRNPKYNDRLIDAVRYSVDRKGNLAKVHIMGTQKKGSGTFRLRFFERGTKIRTHKSGKKIGKTLSKPVLQFTKDGEFIKEWESATAASRQLNIPLPNITNCINGYKYKSAGGFVWKKL